MDYAVVIEWAGGNASGYVPDLPGCVSVGDTVEETLENLREAIGLYLDQLRADGQAIPRPSTPKGVRIVYHPNR